METNFKKYLYVNMKVDIVKKNIASNFLLEDYLRRFLHESYYAQANRFFFIYRRFFPEYQQHYIFLKIDKYGSRICCRII